MSLLQGGGTMANSMYQALSGLSQSMPRVVREHEVLRVSGWMHKDNSEEAAKKAIDEVLKWAQKRCGGRLPAQAWKHESFDYLSGGRNSSCVKLQSSSANFWAMRADDPDKKVAQRVWTTEVAIGLLPDQPARFSARLLVSTPESELLIEPHTPGFVQQVVEACDLYRGRYPFSIRPMLIETEEEAENLIAHLLDPQRELPTFVVTLPPGHTEHPSLDSHALSRAMLGIGHVAVVHSAMTWSLSNRFGRLRSVFGGAARVYMPGFVEDADPYSHRLVLADQIAIPDGAARCARWIRLLAAQESLRSVKLGRDVLAFSAIRSAALEQYQQVLEREGASDADQLHAAKDRIAALEKQIEQQKVAQDYYLDEYEKEKERAVLAEAQSQKSAYRIQTLMRLLKDKGNDPDIDAELPTSWSELPDWCNEHLAGRVELTNNALGGLKKANFQDFETAARCLLWLANEGREVRLSGGGGSINNLTIFDGIQNASCGVDTYEFDWSGRRHSADWHIKNGGNTRDPSRCLRIYYCFDEQTQKIIVSDMPAHRKTAAT
jgi:hypothetical protein